MLRRPIVWLTLLIANAVISAAPSAKEVEDAAWKSFQDLKQFTAQGGYLWWYSTDGKLRAGEGSDLVEKSVIWVQPPGTPTVGLALIRLYDATGDPRYLTAAAEAGEALAWGQLATGGWTAHIDFANQYGRPLHYRRDFEQGDKKPGKRFDASSLDDDITQSAVRFLLELNRRLKGTRPIVVHSLQVALETMLGAQFQNGGWPQCFDLDLDRDRPALALTCPNPWPRERPGGRPYWYDYTINDDAMVKTVDTLLLAHQVTGDAKYLAAAARTGDWLLAARLPEPHPVWAQQYDPQMRPSWARVWEPPTATSLESIGVLERLETLWLVTGEAKYREPIVPALDWFDRVRRPDGTWSRYYELFTNRPIFMVNKGGKEYVLTYEDKDLPEHYGWIRDDLGEPLARLRADLGKTREQLLAERAALPTAASLADAVAKVLGEQDADGRWVTLQDNIRRTPLKVPRNVLEMQRYRDNWTLMADYLAALRREKGQ